jgi:hypothetical protein
VTYSTEHNRLKPVLDQARQFDIATNPALEALFEAGSAGFQIWCTLDDHPKGREHVHMDAGAFAKPCSFVASVMWGWEGETITHLCLETDAYDLHSPEERQPKIQNRPADVSWAKRKIRWLFKHAGIPCPPIWVVRE